MSPRIKLIFAVDRTMVGLIVLALIANIVLFSLVSVSGGVLQGGPVRPGLREKQRVIPAGFAAVSSIARAREIESDERSLLGKEGAALALNKEGEPAVGAASGKTTNDASSASQGETSEEQIDGRSGSSEAPAGVGDAPPSESARPTPGPPRSMLVEGLPDGEPLADSSELGARDDDGVNGKAYTHQTCYVDGDESELCVYDSVMCFDGTSPVVVVDRPTLTEPLIDSANDCMDYRFFEPSTYEWSGCRYTAAGERQYVPAQHPASLKHDHPVLSDVRWWGPLNRHHLFFREVAADDVYGAAGRFSGLQVDDAPAEVTLEAQDTAEVTKEGEGQPQSAPPPPAERLRLARRTRNDAANLTIDWLPDASGLWVVALPGQAWSNPFHWMSSMVGPLYAALRSNASGPPGSNPLDGYMHGLGPEDVAGTVRSIHRDSPSANRVAWRVGPQWDLPPMDVVVGAGDSGREVASVHHLDEWFAGTLTLAVQKGSSVFFNDLMRRYNRNHLLCARRGVVPSSKPKLFSSPSDAWMFRQRSHLQLAGLDPAAVPSHPRLPPRHITLIDRLGMHGRGIYNKQVLLDALAACDVPYTVVDRMDALSFAEQVRLMAGTGLLIAPHGAHLANMAFLPARAAVMELFPPLLKKNGYRYTAQLFNLHYFAVYSRQLLPPNVTGYFGQEVMAMPQFHEECIATNVSSYEALTQSYCQWAAKTYPIIVPARQLREALRDALDAIGAFSLLNPAWKAIAEERQLPPPDHLALFDGWEDTF